MQNPYMKISIIFLLSYTKNLVTVLFFATERKGERGGSGEGWEGGVTSYTIGPVTTRKPNLPTSMTVYSIIFF